MIINSIYNKNNSLITTSDTLTISSIDFISKKIIITQSKTINNFLIYETRLNIGDSKEPSIQIQS